MNKNKQKQELIPQAQFPRFFIRRAVSKKGTMYKGKAVQYVQPRKESKHAAR